MICQILLSPQLKRWAIITYKHGIYGLPHKLLNHLRLRTFGPFPRHFHRRAGSAHTRKKEKKSLRTLGNYEITGKCRNPIE